MRRILPVLLFLACLSPRPGFLGQTATHIVVMHTNDLHGQLLPRDGIGGMAEIATIMRNARPDLILDAGDISTGTFLADEFKGAPMIQAMNKIGYEAGTIGNHEFDYGEDALRLRLREAKFPVLSANVQAPISEIKKSTVITVKVIRLTTEELKTTTHPKNLAGVAVNDLLETLRQTLPEVRRKSDFIIVTAHI